MSYDDFDGMDNTEVEVLENIESDEEFNNRLINTKECNVVFTEEEVESFVKYILGLSEMPNSISKVINNITDKLSVALGFSIANNVRRQSQLQRFIEQLELDLFDYSSISGYEDKDKITLYDKASKALTELQETQRKFVMQNKEIQMAKSKEEQLLTKLLSLPDDDINKVINSIEEIIANPEENKKGIPFTEGVNTNNKGKINLNE